MKAAAFIAWAALNSVAVGVTMLMLIAGTFWAFTATWIVAAVAFRKALAASQAWRDA